MRETADADVIVVGAGPVGLALGNLLSDAGVRTLLVERRTGPRQESRAIGVTPPSLQILRRLNLAEPLIERGLPVRRAVVHGEQDVLGVVAFHSLPAAYRMILAVPQSETEALLEEALRSRPAVSLLRGAEVVEAQEDPTTGGAMVGVRQRSGYRLLRARFVCACDGAGSTVRGLLRLPFDGGAYRAAFLMGDYRDQSGLGEEAHLFFTSRGSVESFPLPAGRRRWIAQTEGLVDRPAPGFLENRIVERSGLALDPADRLWQSAFRPERYLCRSMKKGPFFLCGDAAHVMAPIGGQGMNTGFADAALLAELLHAVLSGRKTPETLALYPRYRLPAVRAATRRAAGSMKVGIVRGTVPSGIRNLLIKAFLNSPLAGAAAPHFAMLTIPYGEVADLPVATGR